MLGIILNYKARKRFAVVHMRLVQGKACAALHNALAGYQNVYGRIKIIRCVRDNIGIDIAVKRGYTLSFKLRKHCKLIFIVKRKLEIFIFRGSGHFAF